MTRASMSRRTLLAAITLLATTLPVVIAAPTASAQGLDDVTCIGSLSATFSPGVSLVPMNQTITAQLKGGTSFLPGLSCTSLAGTPFQGVVASFTGSGVVSCLVGSFTGTATATWDDGQTSTIKLSVTTVGPLPLIAAQVTSGALKGDTIRLLGSPTGITGSCDLLGGSVTGLEFIGLASFLSV